jgi:Flp pilus assembly protein TadD
MNYYLGQYVEAEAAINKAIELAPRSYLNWSNLGDILYVAGRLEESQSAFLEAERLIAHQLSVNPNEPGSLMDLAWIHAMLGDEHGALDEIRKAATAAPDDPYADYIAGLIQNHFGNRDAALDSLAHAVAKGQSPTILKAEPHLFLLKDDRRFRELTTEQ